MTSERRAVVRLIALLIVCTLLAACGGTTSRAQEARLDADYSGSGPGKLDDAHALTGVEPRLAEATSLSARITYISTSGIDDSHPDVTAAVFVPRGSPPQGGWPIIAVGHPQTGIGHACAPSNSPTLMGISGLVADLLRAGYVVTVSDYQGLGVDNSYHPFLDSSTVGFNLIDSVFATRRLVPTTAVDWIALGISQGGQAAWAADELAENAGQGLHLAGAVSVSPVADMEGLVDEATDGRLTTAQKLALQAYLASLKHEYADFALGDYTSGVVRDHWDSFDGCRGPAEGDQTELADKVGADDLRPANLAAAQMLRGYLQKTTLPQGPTAAPMLVVYGDHDPLIPPAWTARAIDRACAMGDTIARDVQPDRAPSDLDLSAAFGWVRDRIDGVPARNDCVFGKAAG
jgi:pimeloyl-ACP methyl ester carboxylesterase